MLNEYINAFEITSRFSIPLYYKANSEAEATYQIWHSFPFHKFLL